MSRRAKSVKSFERSNGLDTALYKNDLYLFRPGGMWPYCNHGLGGHVQEIKKSYTGVP